MATQQELEVRKMRGQAIAEHEGLDGKTPAEKCGITIEGQNKWLTIIQNAKHLQSVNRETK